MVAMVTGTDEDEIISLLTSHSNDQRMEIAEEYKKTFGEVSL